jgi:sugar lactone lactonase YvrE
MATQLIKYEQGSGAGVAIGKNVGKLVIGDNFPSTTADGMYAVACDWSENVFIADTQTNAIYKCTEGGKISLFAGLPNNDGFVNGTGVNARFKNPTGIACDKSGNVYVADSGNLRLRKIDQNGKVTTIAGGFVYPYDCAVAPNGDIIVCDSGAHKIYRVTSSGRVLVVAGSTSGNVAGYIGTTKVKGTAAKFNRPTSVTVDNTGNIYVADAGNYQIKVIYPDGWVRVFAGSGAPGNVNGIASIAKFTEPLRLKVDRSGTLFAIDGMIPYSKIKRIDQNGNVSTFGNPVKNEVCYGIAVSPADKVFVVSSASVPFGYESSSSESSQSSDNSETQTSESSQSSDNSETSQTSESSQSSDNSETSQTSVSSITSANSGGISESSGSSSSESPGSR